ncbi:DUF4157 domain-containing protein [Roseofilum reptotaenium CS-1145]|uniref:eCIS core domain-containing protein n=1 Tax=Roseofilum reptotaenium AO1-A TaxID=1925591 RepID=A0A1L9QWE1_9CYAN|nr:DUF4157 domain-containing protein [Roseofilum reptotaenium]MDB9517990.1 DUF4157 domain-containing protein [Roseofilum reptotaenium CS-1145]OJJ26922.1 hypothetical protein BI308_04330 [Roseofilum reptotaenium AO1-A]
MNPRRRQTRISPRQSLLAQKEKAPQYAVPPVVQPKIQRKTGSELPEWKPSESRKSSPLERLRYSAGVQAKLEIGQPHDPYEQQADQVAQDVVETIHTPQTPSTLQREMGPEGDEEMQMKPMVQRQEAIATGEASTELESSIHRARGTGKPLQEGLQRSMGTAMNADFSGVRVHTDSRADRLNESIQAKAFTTGQDVFFKSGEYQPGSQRGQKLIAHELTHVVQQSSTKPTIQRALATTQEYTTMKANARKEKTTWSGTLSAKNYGKKKNSYEQKRQDNDNAGAFKILLELRKRFTELDKKGDNYWKSNRLKEQYFRPLEAKLIQEMKLVGEILHVRLSTDEAPEVTPRSGADEAAVLWAHLKEDEQSTMAGIWNKEETLRSRICEVLGNQGGQLRLTNLNYVMEAVLTRQWQGATRYVKNWVASDSELSLNEYVDREMEQALEKRKKFNPNTTAHSTEYLDDQARADTQLHFGGGMVYKGTEQTLLTTDGGGDAIVMSDGELFSAKKGDVSVQDNVKKVIQHSSFLSGLPVDTAGMIVANAGTLEKVRGFSGHYKPTTAHLARLCLAMQARGIDMTNVTIEDKDGNKYTGLPKFLESMHGNEE